jgi:hypothetical protein
MKVFAAISCLAVLSACARTEDANVVGNEGYEGVEQVRDEGDEQDVAVGQWRRSLQEERPALEFGPQGTAPVLSIVCADRGGLVLQRHGAVASGAAPTISVSVGAQGRQLPATAAGGTTPMLSASIPAGDALLTQLAEATGPITMRTGDGTPLILPPNELIGQFARSCAEGRAGEAVPAPADGGNAAEPSASSNQANSAAPAR